MSGIIFSGLNLLFIVTGAVGLVGIILLIPAVIAYYVYVSKEKDEITKKAKIKKGIIYAVISFCLVTGALICIAILQIVKKMFGV